MKKIIIGIGVLGILVAAYFLFIKNKSGETQMNMEMPIDQNQPSEPSPTTQESPKATPPITNPTPKPAQTSPTTHTINIQDFAFSQPSLTIKKGDTIVWTNKDSAPHTVTWDNGSQSSGTLKTGESYSFTFNTAGTLSYHCAFHPFMKGKVIVE